jgi:O-antigen/teichoic acid export membrane protein
MNAATVLKVDELAADGQRSAPPTLLAGDTLAQSLVALAVMAIAQRLIGFGRSVLVCGWLPPDQLGEWDLANRFFILAAPLVVLGLPGSFGRYLEHYRQRGVLRSVLLRTTAVCLVLALAAIAVMLAAPEFVAQQVFGRPERASGVAVLAAGLVAVIAYNYLTEMLTGLRLVRVSAVVQFFNTVAFAVLCILLLDLWRLDAMAIVLAYTGACTLVVLAATGWLAMHWSRLPPDAAQAPAGELWRKLVPFAVWVWATNLIHNLFEVVDRYMLLHLGDLADAQTLIGQYHSAQVIPVLFVSVAGLLAGILLPHLSRDWEWGDRVRVSNTLNLAIKLLGLGSFAASVVVILAAPLLFDLVWSGKYAQGFSLLPLALAGCGWLGLSTVAQMYLWCAERARLGCVALAIGLAMNVALNLALIPAYGLPGAVVATATSSFTVLGIVLAMNRGLGMHVQPTTAIVGLLPLTLLFGIWPALLVLGLVALDVTILHRLLTGQEQRQLISVWENVCVNFRRRRQGQGAVTI